MTKIFIISYDHLPRAITASQRPLAWSKYLENFGFHPIIITKNWNKNIKEKIEVSKDHACTIVRINTSENLQTKYWNSNSFKGKILRKISSFLDLLFHASFLFGPYKVATKLPET